MKLKDFSVPITRTTTKTERQCVTVAAECPEDARILAKYKATSEWDWEKQGSDATEIRIGMPTVLPEVTEAGTA